MWVRELQRRILIHQAPVNLPAANASSPSDSQKSLWVFPRLQYWHKEMLNNAEMHRQWKEHFRVSSPTFDQFLRWNLNNKQDTRPRRAVPLQKRVAVALWRLETGNAFILLTILLTNWKTNKIDLKSVNKHADDQTCFSQHYFIFPTLLIGSSLFVVTPINHPSQRDSRRC